MTWPLPFGVSFLAYPLPAPAADDPGERSDPGRRAAEPVSTSGASGAGRPHPSQPRSDDDEPR